MSLFALPWFVMSGLLFTLATVIYSRQRASRVATLFCAMIALVALWFFGFGAMFMARVAASAMISARLAMVAVGFLPAAIYDFTATALRTYARRRPLVIAAWAFSSLFALLVIGTNSVVASVRLFSWGFYPQLGPLGIPFTLVFLVFLGLHLADYVREYRRTLNRARRQRLMRLMISFGIVYISVLDFRPMFGANQRPIGYIPIAAFVLFAWQSIRWHRLRTITAARAASEIVATMADALFVLDSDAKIRVTNDAARSLFGFSNVDILGKTIDTLEYVDPEATFSKTLREMLKRAPIRDEERIFRDTSGNRIEVSISVSPLKERDIEGGAVVIVRDIRQRKLAEEEMRAFTVQLQSSNRELEDFAYVASHDLQEPLRKIQAFGDRLKAKYGSALTDEGLDYLQRMQNAAGRMQTLISDLLAFSRVTTKAQPFIDVDLKNVVAEVVHDLEVRIHQNDASVVYDSLPTIEADTLQMRQLFQNLLSNALKFRTPDVAPRIEISGETRGNIATIAVKDNGIGFDEKYADRIFTMFERLHGRGIYEGTGIGLAICRKIVLRHGGDIRAHSSAGAGATFIVTLPVHHPKGVDDGGWKANHHSSGR